MNGIGKKFNWVRQPSMWEEAQAWRTKRAEMTARFIEEKNVAVNAFAAAAANNTSGLVANAQQAAISRIKKLNKVA